MYVHTCILLMIAYIHYCACVLLCKLIRTLSSIPVWNMRLYVRLQHNYPNKYTFTHSQMYIHCTHKVCTSTYIHELSKLAARACTAGLHLGGGGAQGPHLNLIFSLHTFCIHFCCPPPLQSPFSTFNPVL